MSSEVSFFRMETTWDRLGRDVRAGFKDFNAFYTSAFASMVSTSAGTEQGTCTHVATELFWLKAGKPYYKLWPRHAVMLSKTKLNIPASMLQVPYPAFAIYLPKDPILFQYEHEGRHMEIRSLLAFFNEYPDRPPFIGLAGVGKSKTFSVLIDDGEHFSGQPSRSWLTFPILDGKTIDECVAHIRDRDTGTTSAELAHTALRIAVATALLAVSSHKLVENDVIAALRTQYDRATDAATRSRLVAKSKKRGVVGWCVGRGLSLSTPARSDSEPTGRHLQYSHIRGGHFHLVPFGPGRSGRKVMFYEPTVVREDLPPPPYER